MKVALVYDRINKIGGAERILVELHSLFPEAPIYTSVYNPKKACWAKNYQIKTTFLQSFPFLINHHEIIPFLMPFVFELFNFDQFDLVISLSSAESKGIITKPKTLHLCYCLTPTRYLWSEKEIYLESLNRGFLGIFKKKIGVSLLNYLRYWDKIACKRPDHYLAISKTVSSRINEYYNQPSDIIYPPINTDLFIPQKKSSNDKAKKLGRYFLIVSRLVYYKKIDLAIIAFNNLKKQLLIIGTGKEEKYLKSISRKNIHFITDYLTDEELMFYYQNCEALIFPGEEDFGLTPVEAMACGKPVIAYYKGGVAESVKENITGAFFSEPTSQSLEKVVVGFRSEIYSAQSCRQEALKYNILVFRKKITDLINKYYLDYRKGKE